MKFRIWQVLFLLSSIFLFFYSFTQVDLGLTLSRSSIYQTFEKFFQHIGYFNRPLSTGLYIAILILLTISYLFILSLVKKGKVSGRQVWITLILASIILTFSYNAFSYDLFNNIFDAKIITYYHLNPYQHKALDFPHDPMLSFMHWIERTYPYGPAWLALATLISFLGGQIFLVTFFLFKILNFACFIGTVYVVKKIAVRISQKDSLFSMVLFAFNPLIIIECLVSAHNDIAMMLFALWGIYMLLQKRWVWAFALIIFSALIKQVTIFLLPPLIIYFVGSTFLKNRFISFEKFVWAGIVCMIVGFFYVLTQREFQPWYLLWILPFVAVLRQNRFLLSLGVGLSIGALLRYVPFLYLGNWDGIAIPVRWYVLVITPLVSLSLAFGITFLQRLRILPLAKTV